MGQIKPPDNTDFESDEVVGRPAGRICAPGPILAQFVDRFWSYDCYDPPHSRERLLPTGAVEMVFDLRTGASVVSGAHSEPSFLDTSQPFSVIGVHFKPGGAHPFFKPPMDAIRNSTVPLDELWGGPGSLDLGGALIETKRPAQRFALLERVLISRARHSLSSHPAVRFALCEFERAQRGSRIAHVTERTGLSSRRFIELFRSEVGLTPKAYFRVRRFQQAVISIHEGREVDWAELALDCGYYDQPHFIHDFHSFSGLAPSEYLTARGDHLNHVPVR